MIFFRKSLVERKIRYTFATANEKTASVAQLVRAPDC